MGFRKFGTWALASSGHQGAESAKPVDCLGVGFSKPQPSSGLSHSLQVQPGPLHQPGLLLSELLQV